MTPAAAQNRHRFRACALMLLVVTGAVSACSGSGPSGGATSPTAGVYSGTALAELMKQRIYPNAAPDIPLSATCEDAPRQKDAISDCTVDYDGPRTFRVTYSDAYGHFTYVETR